MKARLLSGWNVRRLFYLLAGSGLIILSIQDHQWFGVAFGIYFASMGLFAFGCAAGNCFGGTCSTDEDVHQSQVWQTNEKK